MYEPFGARENVAKIRVVVVVVFGFVFVTGSVKPII